MEVGKNFDRYFSGKDLPKVHSKMVLQHFGVDVARSLMQLIEIHSKKKYISRFRALTSSPQAQRAVLYMFMAWPRIWRGTLEKRLCSTAFLGWPAHCILLQFLGYHHIVLCCSCSLQSPTLCFVAIWQPSLLSLHCRANEKDGSQVPYIIVIK